MFELSKQFRFDAAHTLERAIETDSSRRIHGHSYRAEVTIRGEPDKASGMLMDLGLLARALEETRGALDHRFLDEIDDLGPATLENLCAWIWRRLAPTVPALARVTVHRDSSGDTCAYWGSGRALIQAACSEVACSSPPASEASGGEGLGVGGAACSEQVLWAPIADSEQV